MNKKKDKAHRFSSLQKLTPTRLGEMMTDGLPALVLWNFLFIVTCIPLITIGPSMAAISFCTNALVLDDRPLKHPARLYFHAFRTSFVRSIPLGICFLLVSSLLGTGLFIYLSFSTENSVFLFLSSFSLLMLLIFWGVIAHLYPLLFDFEKTDWKNQTPVLVHTPLRALLSDAGIITLTRMTPTTIGLGFSIVSFGLLVLLIPVSIPLIFTISISTISVAMALAHTSPTSK